MALTKINSSVIANNTIAVGNIADNSVDATKIASNSILTRHIDDNQIGIDQLNVSDGSNGQMLTTNGSGTLSFSTPSSFDADAAQTFNDSGAAVDFRIEGDTEQNLFFVDGSADKIGIGLTSPVTKFNIQGASASTYTGAGPSDILRVSQSTAGAWIVSDFDGAFAYMGNDSSTTGKFAAYNYATTAEMNMILGQDRMYIKAGGNVGIGTTNPDSLLHLNSGNRDLKFILADSPSTGNVGAQIRGGSGEYIGIAADGTGIGIVVTDSNTVGIGTTSPSSKLHLESGSAHNKLSITSTANGGTGYDAVIDLLGSASNSEVQLNMGINGDADREQIKTYQSVMSFRANNKNGIQLDGVSSNSNTEGNLRQHYSTDSGSYKRYTATLNPRIAEVGLQGYWDPTKANSYSGNTVYDFSPATHGNGNQDLTKESGVTHVTNSNRAVWQFDGTGNAGMYGNPNLAAGKSASFSLWVYWNDVTSLSSSYQLNGIQIGNHYMYIGIVQGANDSAPLYGYAGQGTNIPPSSANNYEQAYVNSDEWVYLTIQFGHGSSDVTSRTKGRAEVYLNGSLVQRRDNIALPTVAANGSASFLLGRVQGGYYLDGYMGPAVLYERTLHQWEILENMRVHADMYMS